jgi:S-adenosylmethionine-diacylglycerol 3-amino-3-carboxypropyl transferase
MTDLAPSDLASSRTAADVPAGGRNRTLKKALIQHRPLTASGLSERFFGLLFSGLVYPQIWEDPAVDMEAMEIRPEHHIVTIGSGGCNVLAYLSAAPERIDVVDLNRHHIALNRLKLAAFRHLPAHADLVRFLARENVASNIAAYDLFIAPKLDTATRAYWSARGLDGRRRIRVFAANLYRTGLLGRFIWLSHMLAKAHGVDPAELTATRSLREQRQFFDERLAPLFDRPVIRWLTSRKSSLFGLGIPPQQFDELASLSTGKTLAPVLRQRLEKLVCHFPLRHNYFAWQAFGRRYPLPHEGMLPLYLQPERYEAIRNNAERVHVHHESFTELLARKPAGSVDRYVLLDAQDWMTDVQLNDLWREVTRTAAPGAVVIFRTAAERSILEGRVETALLDHWHYDASRSEALNLKDRSAIYGGFHIYRHRA